LRVKGYLPSKDDITSQQAGPAVRMAQGDHVMGASRPAMRNEKNPACYASTRSTARPEQARKRRRFEDLTPVPDEAPLETADDRRT
jgi:transcription termination factor Rho